MSVPLYLAFEAAGALCTIALSELTRVEEKSELLAVPYAHQALAGLSFAEGRPLVPVYDFYGFTETRRVLNRTQSAEAVAIIEGPKGELGFLIDKVLGTLRDWSLPEFEDETPWSFSRPVEAKGEIYLNIETQALLAALQ